MLPETSKRIGGDWPPELERLRGDPVMMLLAGVVLRARSDARENASARRFLRRVQKYHAEVRDAGYAVLMAMVGTREVRAGKRAGRW